ncbi:MAG: hypothetical protein CMN91_11895 [Synechococcus sp. ARS1019]|nr:hypothetical protein [Synechococcus sp. ARS1019]
MNFFEVYITGWKKCFDIEGRTSRMTFWSYVGQAFLVYLIVVLVSGLLKAMVPNFVGSLINAIIALFFFGSVIPLFSIQIRRTRDATGNPWWWVAGFFPFFGAILMLIIYLSPTRGFFLTSR